ncbi:MAG: hypothetical protein C0508_21940 [Cyanobacteria bacterium PR.023]|nr:hypothetical protein [Cyanobacteria bacterium PR.023]
MRSCDDEISLEAGSTSWIGLQIEDCIVESLIGEGAFSWTYLGKAENGSSTVFKVAKPAANVGKFSSGATQIFPTRALLQITGAYCDVRLDAVELLSKQAQRLKSSPHKNLLEVQSITDDGVLCYYRYEYVSGKTLRQLIQSGEATQQTLIKLAQTLEHIAKESDFGAHGDLKPENIVFGQSGIKLIDPGYFGDVLDLAGSSGYAAVTTPAYYPTLEPDDLFAFGVMAWEILVGHHPFHDELSSAQPVAPDLLELVRASEIAGNFFISRILQVRHPSELNPKISLSLGTVLLKLLRLKINEKQQLALDDGFRSFGAIAGALLANSEGLL